jgi:hypothetical protein
VFSQDGVEKHHGDTNSWTFDFEGKLWVLSDSRPESKTPCQSLQYFSQRDLAYIIQATSPAEERWKEWTKECRGMLFAMKYFSEREAKALRSVIIASILLILFDLLSLLTA